MPSVPTAQALADEALRMCDEWKTHGKLRPVKVDFVERFVDHFQYYDDGHLEYSVGHRRVTRDMFVEEDVSALRDTIERSPSFTAIHSAMTTGDASLIAGWGIDQFVRRLVDACLYEEGTGRVAELVEAFARRVRKEPPLWMIKSWLGGLYLQTEPIVLEDGIVLRRLTEGDLEGEEKEAFVDKDFYGLERMWPEPSAILEVRRQFNSPPGLLSHLLNPPVVEEVKVALLLYRAGFVVEQLTESESDSSLFDLMESQPSYNLSTVHPVSFVENGIVLNVEDASRFPKFFREIHGLIPIDDERHTISKDIPVGTALSRYLDSILKPDSLVVKIAYVIIGLEAIYLKHDEKGKERKLASRISAVPKLIHDSQGKVSETIHAAYKARSEFVHGDAFDDKERVMEYSPALDEIREYLRKSILLFLQLGLKKDELIDLIDRANSDENSKSRLFSLISERVLITP